MPRTAIRVLGDLLELHPRPSANLITYRILAPGQVAAISNTKHLRPGQGAKEVLMAEGTVAKKMAAPW